MATVRRKSTSAMQPEEWKQLIDAINRLHGLGAKRPAYRDFINVHELGMTNPNRASKWRVHTMPAMPAHAGMRAMKATKGDNFLAWHRQLLIRFERRLQLVHPSVFIPYWDWIANPNPPARISDPALLDKWGVIRDPDPSQMPKAADVGAVNAKNTFEAFQSALENGPHNEVHNAIGGLMESAGSPADPLFFMHHANVDRLWYQWQEIHPAQNPSNMDELLQPALLFNVPVSSVVDRARLPYSYA